MRGNRRKSSDDTGGAVTKDPKSRVPKETTSKETTDDEQIELAITQEEKDENIEGTNGEMDETGREDGAKGNVLGDLSRNSPTKIASSKHKDVIVNFSESLGLNDPKIADVFARFVPSMFLKKRKIFVPTHFEIDMSQYDPAAYVDGQFKEQIRHYELTLVQRFFVTLEIHDSSYVSIFYFLLLQGVIILSAVSMISASMNNYQQQPTTCANPVCDNDATLCPNIMVCEPEPYHYFDVIDFICACFFGVDYALRLCTCWTVSPILSNIVPDDWYHHEFHKANIEGRDPRDEPTYSKHGCFFRYFLSIPNLMDLASFLPYFIDGNTGGHSSLHGGGSQTMFVRLVRLLRLLRLFKLSANSSAITHILYQALSKSFHAGSYILFCVVVGIVLFGSIIYILEGGEFKVTTEYPNGQYFRRTLDGSEYEISPYQSIPVSMYWAVVTLTTLGYGDFYPTSTYGRIIASICAIFGVLVLAFPVSLLGTYFNEAHHEHSNASGILHKIDLAASKFLVNLKGTKPIKNIIYRGIRKVRKSAYRAIKKSDMSSDERQDNFRLKWLEIIEKLKKLQILKTSDTIRHEVVDQKKHVNHRGSIDMHRPRPRLHRENDGVGVPRDRHSSISGEFRDRLPSMPGEPRDRIPSMPGDPALLMRVGQAEPSKEVLEKMDQIMQVLARYESGAQGNVVSNESSRLETEVLSQKMDQNLYNFHEIMERLAGVTQQQHAIVNLIKRYDATNSDMVKNMQVLSSRMNKLNEKLNIVEKQTTQHHIIIHTDNAAAAGGGGSMGHQSLSPPASSEANLLTAESVTSTGRLRMLDRVLHAEVADTKSPDFNHAIYNHSIAESRVENIPATPSVAIEESVISDETVNGSLDEYEYELYDE